MRLTVSLLAALVCHGVLFGIGAVVLSRRPSERVAEPTAVEIEVVAAKPDPIAAAAPAADRAPSTSVLHRTRTSRHWPQVAIASRKAAEVRRAVADVAALASPTVGMASAAAGARPSGAASSTRPIDGAGASGGAVLTAKPRYRTNPTPEYPIASRRRGEEGVVLLNVAVDASGAPTTISLNHSSGYPLLDRAALDAVRRWTFEPARSGGVAMFSLVVVPVRFSLEDRR